MCFCKTYSGIRENISIEREGGTISVLFIEVANFGKRLLNTRAERAAVQITVSVIGAKKKGEI